MNPTCIVFVKAAMALSQMLQTNTEPGFQCPSCASMSDSLRYQATGMDSKDKAILYYRSTLANCLKVSPEILK